jgi:SAM-dependent methyltransferase
MSSSVRQSVSAYDPFALIYNSTIAEDFCRRAWPVIEHLLLKQLPSCARILDLCCGSGQMARELGRCGYRVVGLDVSEQMIQLARQNAPAALFFLADARNFHLIGDFDAVLSSFNSLSHASTVDELQSIFRNARYVLGPGAPMLFDLSMEEAYTSKWRGSFGDAHDELAWIVCSTYDSLTKQARNGISLFRRQGTAWDRHDFSISQKCHSESDIRAALFNSGFTDIRCYDAERDLHMQHEAGRSYFLCR